MDMLNLTYLLDIEFATGYMSLGLGSEVWVGDIHLRIMSNYMVFKITAVSEIQDRLSVGRQKTKDLWSPTFRGWEEERESLKRNREGVSYEMRGNQEGVVSWQPRGKSLSGKR